MNSQSQLGRNGGINTGNNLYLIDEVQNFLQEKNIQNPESRRALIRTLSNQTGMSEAEASNKVDQWTRSYQELKAEAKVRADQTAKAVSTASIVGFIALLVGALVTIWGARKASLKEKEYSAVNKTERNALVR